MFNIIKKAALYTGIYFIITTVFFWAMIFIHIAILIFWKPVVAVFFIALAVLTFNHYKCGDRIKALFTKPTYRPRGGDIIVAARKEHAAAA